MDKNELESNQQNKSKIIIKKIIISIMVSLICMFINYIYAQFGHGVSSNYMTYMFLYPLVIGIVTSVINIKNVKISSNLFICGIATITLGSFLQGIFEIAGTSTPFQSLYYILGCILIFFGIIYIIIDDNK